MRFGRHSCRESAPVWGGRTLPRQARTGFSLLELLLILAIVATLAAIAVPRYANALVSYRADGLGLRIVADLERAQRAARATSSSVSVVFDVANNRYDIPAVASIDDPLTAAGVSLAGEPYQGQLVSADFGGDESVTFDGYGRPDTGGQVVISCGGTTRTIDLDADTGIASMP